MRSVLGATICSAMIALAALSSPAFAQQKTVKACGDEWRANREANQAAGITLKSYVEKCRAGTASTQAAPAAPAQPAPAATTTAAAPQKTVKVCTDEWRANRAANQAAGVTLKSYVEACRAGTAPTQAAPAAPAAPAQPAPAATTAAPAAPAARQPAAAPPAARTPPATTTAAAPAGGNQFAEEGLAKARCPSDTVVWANTDSKIYHFTGYSDYGHTKVGGYMCEGDAKAGGFRAAKNEKHP